MSARSILQQGRMVIGQSGKAYIVDSPIVQREYPHVWRAFGWNDERRLFVLKHEPERSSAFQMEIEMQRHFQTAMFIRRMVDVIPESPSTPHMMVLEPFEKTLWSARTQRPLSTREIKHIMRLALLGLREIHQKGLVYCDFKMENVLLNGFDNEKAASDDPSIPLMINVKLSDLGSVMAPGIGQVTPITYRSPEVYFGKPWTSAIDIWAWGIAYFHLIQAQVDFSSPGIFDSVIKDGTLEEKAHAVQAAQVHDFDIRWIEYFQNCDFSAFTDAGDSAEGHWTDRLVSLGVPEYDVVFLYAVLQPDPAKRMTVDDILDTKYLDVY